MQPYFIPTLLRSRALTALVCLLAVSISARATHPDPHIETATVLNSGSGCTPFHALSAYQVGSEIWVTTALEDHPGGCWTAIVNLTRPIEVSGPAILARNVGDLSDSPSLREERNAAFESDNYQLLSRYGVIKNSYDPALGNGWAETNSIGWVYVPELPYLYSPQFGWIYYQAGGVMPRYELGTQNGADGMGEAEATLFYLWSETRGWLITYSDAHGRYYDVNNASWLNIYETHVDEDE